MNVERYFTRNLTLRAPNAPDSVWSPGNIENAFSWKMFHTTIKENDRVILDASIEAPATWSQQAVTILAHKYLRKAGVPSATTPSPKHAAHPQWLQPKVAHPKAQMGAETSARQVFRRLAGHWTFSAALRGYFGDLAHTPWAVWEGYAQTFYDEVFYTLASQMAAPNSPQWFNTGLWWAYGIEGNKSSTNYIVGGVGGKVEPAPDTYSYPQTSACFILGVRDSLLGKGGIYDSVTREARIFKYGSGAGSNFSSLRAKGSPLSNGGTSSGMMSFLKLFDTGAGTIKSGGTTRRAAKMAIVDTDHPEAIEFAAWKAREELKVQTMKVGAEAILSAKGEATPYVDLLKGIRDTHFEGEAYNTVSGQNANNSLRASDAFMRQIEDAINTPEASGSTSLVDRNTRNMKLWDVACEAAWACGDPGFQFDDTINRWHTIPKAGRQRATNPCSEYAFIDNSSCNLASLNLVKFWVSSETSWTDDTDGDEGERVPHARYFDARAFAYACRLWTTILDVSVGMSSYPDAEIAQNSVNYRAVGLGYANLGGLMMLVGEPYDSEEARAYAGMVTAIMHGAAWKQSHLLAKELGAFHEFEQHERDVDRVLGLHRDAARRLAESSVADRVRSDGAGHPFADCLDWITTNWCSSADGTVLTKGGAIRNAQLTLLAPTGTIGLVMGCDATGIEPVYMLTSMKKLAGGGYMQQEVGLLSEALLNLGLEDDDISKVITHVRNTGSIRGNGILEEREEKIFHCANDIGVMGHLGMMAAVQPFLSGAISKTVNLPQSATVGDVSETYLMAWRLGLKAIALYRDGCKLSQPLTAVAAAPATHQQSSAQAVSSAAASSSSSSQHERSSHSTGGATSASATGSAMASMVPTAPSGVRADTEPMPSLSTSTSTSSPTSRKGPVMTGLPPRGAITPRYKLPSRRGGWTQKVVIDGHTIYLRTGEFPDGRLGEVFLTVARDGSTINHMACAIAMSISLGLQHGVPLQEYVDAFTDSRAEPSGLVQGSDVVRMCTSLMDYVVRELNAFYGSRETNIPLVVQSPEPHGVAEVAVENKSAVLTLPENTGSSGMGAELQRVAGIRTLSAGVPGGSRYTGNACRACGSFALRRSGTCYTCDKCGETSGCS